MIILKIRKKGCKTIVRIQSVGPAITWKHKAQILNIAVVTNTFRIIYEIVITNKYIILKKLTENFCSLLGEDFSDDCQPTITRRWKGFLILFSVL